MMRLLHGPLLSGQSIEPHENTDRRSYDEISHTKNRIPKDSDRIEVRQLFAACQGRARKDYSRGRPSALNVSDEERNAVLAGADEPDAGFQTRQEEPDFRIRSL